MIVNSEDRGAPETNSAKVSVIIPCRPEYVAIARLAILGVANRLAYSYDEVEDVRLAVGEACTHAVERVYKAAPSQDPTIWIDCAISPEGLNIEVRDNVPPASDEAINVPEELDDEVSFDKQDLGALLMEILVDSVSVNSNADGTVVRLFKRAPQPESQTGAA